jgi:serine protease Do
MATLAAIPSLTALSDELTALGDRLRASTVQVRTQGRGIGSGIVWRVGGGSGEAAQAAQATVVTNAHVVRATDGAAITVRTSDGREVPATVAGADPEHDLAALRVPAAGLTAAEIGDSSALRVGELVMAVGNPFGREGAVTIGVVAARAPVDPDAVLEPAEEPDSGPGGRRGWMRRAPDLIQADLRLYPGNSGGPLADAAGRVVGVNAMISGGLAFAIPSRLVGELLDALERPDQRLRLGVEVLTVAVPEPQRVRLGLAYPAAVMIVGVEPDSLAAHAGLLVGDLLVDIQGRAIAEAGQLLRALRTAKLDQPLRLAVVRGGARVELAVEHEQRAA